MANKWDPIVPEKSLIQLLDEACERNAQSICFSQAEESITYTEVAVRSRAIASALIASGFSKGFRAAVYSPNDMRAMPAILGIIRAGGTWLPVNPRNSLEDNTDYLKRFECGAVFFHSFFKGHIESVQKVAKTVELSVGIDAPIDGIPFLDDWSFATSVVDSFPSPEPTDIVSMPMTGGTTGDPKAVGLSNRNFAGILSGVASVSNDATPPVYLAAAPMTHVGGRIALTIMHRNGRSVILPKIDPQEVLKTIEGERVTDVFLPPSAIYGLLDQPNVREFDFSSLRCLGYGSAPMSVSRLKEAIEVFGLCMQGGFGQTECPMVISTFPPEKHKIDGEFASDKRLSSCGHATPVSEITILDEDGEALPQGECGEIAVKSPTVMEGYVGNPDATAATQCNGWHLTGDIGYLDEDGYLYITDRKKDMIITGGFNVYSAEVENVISTLKGVKECAVIGVPDEKWGEAVKAVVRLNEEEALSEKDIIEYCKSRLGGVKSPKSVDFVSDFPRSPIGKILKRDLRDQRWKGRDRMV